MKQVLRAAMITASMFSISAEAAYLNGTIEYVQVDPASGGVYVRLTGAPMFDGGGCPNAWARGSLDDQNVMVYVWPAIMSAKNHGKTMTINVLGCVNGYPKIDWVQVNP